MLVTSRSHLAIVLRELQAQYNQASRARPTLWVRVRLLVHSKAQEALAVLAAPAPQVLGPPTELANLWHPVLSSVLVLL
jgi:hypothetical protein